METLGYLASDLTSPNLLIPDLTPTLPIIGLASSLVVTSWGIQIPRADAVLSRNDRCDAVTDLQNALIKAGFDPGDPDGVFGGATEYAVMRFQEKNQLKSDRIVGQTTATALGLDPNIACETTPPTASEDSDDSIAVISIPVRFGKITTEGDPLNVRSGPSVDYGVISTVENGAAVRFVGQPVGAWLQLVDGGWIHSDWVEFVKVEKTSETANNTQNNATSADNKTAETSTTQATTQPTAQSTTQPTAQSTAQSTTQATTSQASMTSPTSDTSKTESTGTNAPVEEAKGGPATPVERKDMEVQRVQVKTGGSDLNVRQSASYEAKILNQLKDGEVVTALVPKGQDNLPEWVELSSGGWVASSWLEVQGTVSPQG